MRLLARLGGCGWFAAAALGGYASIAAADQPATPHSNPTERIVLKELWRIGDDDAVLFGLPVDVAVGPDKNIYILDTKLSEIKVISPEGTFLRIIGRSGEGPGEFSNATDITLLPNAQVGVVQPHPAKLVVLHTDGKAAPVIDFDTDVASGNSTVITHADYGGECFIVCGFDLRIRNESRAIDRESFVSRFSTSGKLIHDYYRSTRSTKLGDATTTIRELDFDSPSRRMTVDQHGRVLVANERDKYFINVYRPDGTLEKSVQRDVGPWHWPLA